MKREGKFRFVKDSFLILLLLIPAVAVMLAGCGSAPAAPAAKEEKEPVLTETAVLPEEEFGGVYITITIDDFNKLGFEYGDSVDLVFSNGYTLKDLPYYNGYYVPTGDPLLIAYPGYPYIKAAINNGDDLYKVAGLDEKCTASVTLCEQGKYLDIQNARNLQYKDDRATYPSDTAFANFRNISVGSLKEGVLYRSASPCDNQHNRAPYVDSLISEAGVQFILDLADTDDKILGYIKKDDFDSPYFLSLYEKDQVLAVALNMNFASDVFRDKLAKGLAYMAKQPGPYLVHCTEGKDRTGFVCMLLEAFAGAGYDEIVEDYMITYDNYYQFTKESDSARYDIIVSTVLDPMIREILPDKAGDPADADLAAAACAYLSMIGMTDEEIEALRDALIQES